MNFNDLVINKDKLEKHIYSPEYILLGLNEYIATFLPNNTLESFDVTLSYQWFETDTTT